MAPFGATAARLENIDVYGSNILLTRSFHQYQLLALFKKYFWCICAMLIWCYVKSLEDKFLLLDEGFGYNKFI